MIVVIIDYESRVVEVFINFALTLEYLADDLCPENYIVFYSATISCR